MFKIVDSFIDLVKSVHYCRIIVEIVNYSANCVKTNCQILKDYFQILAIFMLATPVCTFVWVSVEQI